MKKFIVVIGLLFAFTQNVCAENQKNWFVGAGVAFNDVFWSKETKRLADYYDREMQNGLNTSINLQFGIKHSYTQIYNYAYVADIDYMFDQSINDGSFALSEFKVGFSALSLSFDNYIRFATINKRRSDFVFGVGLSLLTENIRFIPTPSEESAGFNKTDISHDTSGAVVLKFGYNQQITEKIDCLAGLRLFFSPDSIIPSQIINLGVGFRYNF